MITYSSIVCAYRSLLGYGSTAKSQPVFHNSISHQTPNESWWWTCLKVQSFITENSCLQWVYWVMSATLPKIQKWTYESMWKWLCLYAGLWGGGRGGRVPQKPNWGARWVYNVHLSSQIYIGDTVKQVFCFTLLCILLGLVQLQFSTVSL